MIRRRWLAPEVIQSSAMDCGPAALKCLLEGLGVHVSYGRLREACQTDVDGTSIDTLEDIAVALGLDAEQVMLPLDHVLLPEADALPALAVVRLPDGNTHFSVIWRRVGGWVQVMDPGVGRIWLRASDLLGRLYVHEMPVPADEWREWASSDEFLAPLRARLGALGCAPHERAKLEGDALADPSWRTLAIVDASARLVAELTEGGALRRGPEAARALAAIADETLDAADDGQVPTRCWSARRIPGDAESVRLRGAVLVKVKGLRKADAAALPRDLAAALHERPTRPALTLLRTIVADGLAQPGVLVLALLLASAGVLLEVALFRGLITLGAELGLVTQRLAAWGALLLFALALLLLELGIAALTLAMGRRLEGRLRVAFLEKIPRLGVRYFRSRLMSDMAERAHSLTGLRDLPSLAGELLRAIFALALTAAGVIWLDPSGAALVLPGAILLVGLALAAQPALAEQTLRFRTHAGVLGRVYHDALLGAVPIRTHGAALAVRREHEHLLVEWFRTGLALLRAAVAVQGVQLVAGFALAVLVVSRHASASAEVGATLLLVYWALRLPELGQRIGELARLYPGHRTRALRLLEPLGAPDEEAAQTGMRTPELRPSAPGVAIELRGVSVVAAGNPILEGVDLTIAPGEEVAIVGPSGAGKSSLVGLLLGFHPAAAGEVRVDGEPLDGHGVATLRRSSAWIDPAIQLWQRPLLDNLLYGAEPGRLDHLGGVLGRAELIDVLTNLPAGLQSPVGEGGAGLSGGEGQRVRLARAMLREKVRLVILDEPLRGLDRARRKVLMERLRRAWPGATLLCVTHDVELTLEFPRVLVIDGGALVADGPPRALAADLEGPYGAMLAREREVQRRLWGDPRWRRLRMERGQVREDAAEEGA
ncbi:MAG: ATP-binding cassette domain-containing protein [Myxococcales bacterium]|nr:ATP-binding cassette domain-containing protein [Myxococcales bacterium]